MARDMMRSLTISLNGLKKIEKELGKMSAQSEKVLRATGRDMKSRIPGYVAQEVIKTYGIKKSEIIPSKKSPRKMAGKIFLRGDMVSEVTVTYKGRLLTPVHFSMTPKKPDQKGKRIGRRKMIKATIKDKQKKVLHSQAFLGTNRGSGYIPFRREGKARKPIVPIKTVSLPQMVSNATVNERIEKRINVELEKRLEHNIERFMK